MEADHHDKALRQEARTHLTIYSETGSAAKLAGRVGVVPDQMWNKGDLNKNGRAYETTAISYQVDRSADASPGEQLGELLERIKPLGERFRADSDAGNVVRLKLAVFEDADNIMLLCLPLSCARWDRSESTSSSTSTTSERGGTFGWASVKQCHLSVWRIVRTPMGIIS